MPNATYYPNAASAATPSTGTLISADAENEAAVIADLGRRVEAAGAIPVEHLDYGLIVRLRRDDEVLDVLNLEHLREEPRSVRGSARFTDASSFAAYVTRLADTRTTVWSDRERSAITAVFNDHAGPQVPGWRDHTAVFRPQTDPDWAAWIERSGKLGSSEAFAEFLEEHYAAIIEPSAADMLEIATTFQAHRSVSFSKGTRLQSGDVQLRYQEETSASAGARGNIEIPSVFTVSLAPYLGLSPVKVIARLRYRIREGNLAIGYVLHRPDEVQESAFEALTSQVKTGLPEETPVYFGQAPAGLR